MYDIRERPARAALISSLQADMKAAGPPNYSPTTKNMKTQLVTSEELSRLAQTIRDEKFTNNAQSILWAVQYHLPLVLWNIERPIDLVNALLIASFNGTEQSICNVLGLERSLQIGSPICQVSSYYGDGNIKVADTNDGL